jgi:dihydrofolate reductase
MRRVKLLVATSLDGHIAGPDEEIDWLFSDQDYGVTAFFGSVDTVLLGRKTYDIGVKLGQAGYRDKINYIFSRSRHEKEHEHVNWVSEDPVEFTRKLKKKSGKDIWLVGGGEVFALLLDGGVVDDILLALHPIILGQGISLYTSIQDRRKLHLVKTESYDTGLVSLHYEVINPGI